MMQIFKRLQGISVENNNSKKKAALSIEAHFPITGTTDLRIAGVPMKLASSEKNALFAMEIIHCTSPAGYSNLIIRNAGNIGVGGENKVPGKKPVFVPESEDDFDDLILCGPADARLPKKDVPQYANPFPWSELISVEHQRNKDHRDWKTESSRISVQVDGNALGDGTYEGLGQGKREVVLTTEAPTAAAIELIKFIKMLSKLKESFDTRKWNSSSIALDGNSHTSNERYFTTTFPALKGNRWKWHTVDITKEKTRPRKLVCVEVECNKKLGRYFYIIEVERKNDAHCTALLRKKTLGRIDKESINDFLKATTYNNGWPDVSSSKFKNEKTKDAVKKLQLKNNFLVDKSRHPHNRDDKNWRDTLLADIDSWLDGA
jgi:hypothetical protein